MNVGPLLSDIDTPVEWFWSIISLISGVTLIGGCIWLAWKSE